MAEFCACGLGLSNTGFKEELASVTRRLFFMNTIADDGTRNAILSTDTIDETYILAKLNETDKSKRWYPSPELKNIVDERADPSTESFNDGSTAITSEGVRAFIGLALKSGPVFLGKLEAIGCEKVSAFYVDACNGITGSVSSDGLKLYPVQIASGSYYSKLVKISDAGINKVQMQFNVSTLEKDSNLRVVKAESDVDLLSVDGLYDVNAAISGASTTGFVAALTMDYGNFAEPLKVKNWVVGDFSLYNETDLSSVIITSVTESPSGTYTFVIPAQTSADVMTLTSQKDGFELRAATVTVP